MLPKLFQAGFVDVFQPAHNHISANARNLHNLHSLSNCVPPSFSIRPHLHARRTSRDLPALLQAFNLSSAIRIRLALHEIVIVGLAPRADEERSAH
jgi:hypothetical protein